MDMYYEFNDKKRLSENECKKYRSKFFTAVLKDSYVRQAISILKKMEGFKERYATISSKVYMPPLLVGVIHYLESNFNVNTHLHNGDPLTNRTVRIPKGRPKTGNPPFTWEESAIDALYNYGCKQEWNIGMALWTLERYNGFGYKYRNIESPYLWNGTNLYTKGKFVADGKFDPNAVSKQVGGAVILRIAYLKYYVKLEDPDLALYNMLNS